MSILNEITGLLSLACVIDSIVEPLKQRIFTCRLEYEIFKQKKMPAIVNFNGIPFQQTTLSYQRLFIAGALACALLILAFKERNYIKLSVKDTVFQLEREI